MSASPAPFTPPHRHRLNRLGKMGLLARHVRPLMLFAFMLSGISCSTASQSPVPALDWYARLGGQAILADVEADEGNDASTPIPGVSLTLGSYEFLESISFTEYDRAVGLEVTLERDFIEFDGDEDGNWTRYLGGARFAYGLDQKIKYGFTLGLSCIGFGLV